jgi:hypothetical protein
LGGGVKPPVPNHYSSIGGLQQLGYAALHKSREALTNVPKRPRSEGSTLIKEVNPPKRPRNSMRPETYMEALTNKTEKPHTSYVTVRPWLNQDFVTWVTTS